MPESRKRGGKKAHNKRVKRRTKELKNLLQKQVNAAYEKFNEWKKSNNQNTNDQSI